MKKLLFAICLLTAVFIVPTDPGRGRTEWEIAVNTGEEFRVDLRIESFGALEWKLQMRGQILNLTYTDRRCFAHWGPCHA